MKIPKYVEKLLKDVVWAGTNNQTTGCYGYTYKLQLGNNSLRWDVFENNAEKLCKWAEKNGAESKILGRKFYTVKEHRKPHYMKDYILFTMTDPVANELEKIGLLKK
jgi:hypothetical protein